MPPPAEAESGLAADGGLWMPRFENWKRPLGGKKLMGPVERQGTARVGKVLPPATGVAAAAASDLRKKKERQCYEMKRAGNSGRGISGRGAKPHPLTETSAP
jgi:hypothetical protein